MKKVLLFLMMAFVAVPAVHAIEMVAEDSMVEGPAAMLTQTAEEIREILHEMHESLEVAVDELGMVGIEGVEATASLQKLYDANEHAYDCATISPEGIIVAVAPEEMLYIVGMDISHQEHIQQMKDSHGPVVSTAIDTVEGFVGFDLEHPVKDSMGTYLGSVSILTEPKFFGSVISQKVAAYPVEIWMMQKDGRIIYDVNEEEVGKNLFTDELYADFPSLVAAGREMATVAEGESSYMFLDADLEQTVQKELMWTTIELHGTEFRLALAYIAADFE